MIFLASLILLLPGLALVVLLEQEERDPICLLTTAALSAVAVWVLSFWALCYVPLSLGQWVADISGLSAVGLMLLWRRARALLAGMNLGRGERVALAVLGALALLRLLPSAVALVAPGADMSMNSYMVRLILEADGVPGSYQPILPVEDFGTYAAGLPAVSAALATISGKGAVPCALAVGCISHVLVTLAVYCFVRCRYGVMASLVSAVLATFASSSPQSFFSWGGNPTVLALALAGTGLALIHRVEGPTMRAGRLALAALVLAASPAVNAVIPYVTLMVLTPVLLLRLWRGPGPQRLALIKNGLTLVALAAVMLAPYLVRFKLVLSEGEQESIFNWQLGGATNLPEPGWWLPLNLLPYVVTRLGPLAAWLALALLIRRRGRGPGIQEELLLLVLPIALVLNAYVWILPASYALYPERVLTLLILPAARIIADAAEGLWPALQQRMSGERRGAWRGLAWGGVVLYAVSVLGCGGWYYLVDSLRDVSITRDDLAAIQWIRQNTPPDAVIQNSYTDGGIWIPALAFRAVKHPHFNVIYSDEMLLWRITVEPRYLYVGAKQVYHKDQERITVQILRTQPGRYRRVFSQGRAEVWQRVAQK